MFKFIWNFIQEGYRVIAQKEYGFQTYTVYLRDLDTVWKHQLKARFVETKTGINVQVLAEYTYTRNRPELRIDTNTEDFFDNYQTEAKKEKDLLFGVQISELPNLMKYIKERVAVAKPPLDIYTNNFF